MRKSSKSKAVRSAIARSKAMRLSWERRKVEMNAPIESDLLSSRGLTHGSFDSNARISQALKQVMRSAAYHSLPNTVFIESLDMIASKISRILSGRGDFKDHWDDIAGYATLAANKCSEPE